MFRLASSVYKEMLLLWRDRVGLAMLYLMPLVLVLVVCLVQEGAFQMLRESRLPLLLLNQDQGPLGQTIEEGLQRSPFFRLQKQLAGQPLTPTTLRQAVTSGRFQLGIVIPPGASKQLQKRAATLARQSLARSNTPSPSPHDDSPRSPSAPRRGSSPTKKSPPSPDTPPLDAPPSKEPPLPANSSARGSPSLRDSPAGRLSPSARGASLARRSPLARRSLSGQGVRILIYFDPTIRASFKQAVLSSLRRFIDKIELRTLLDAMLRAYRKALPQQIGRCLEETMKKARPPLQGSTPPSRQGSPGKRPPPLPRLRFPWKAGGLIGLQEKIASTSRRYPTSVQQNVPAWTLFAMFFVVIPLSGSLIREREQGTLSRLLTMPISYTNLILSRVLVYLVVCLSQFALMLLVGRWLLPWLGTPVLQMGSQPWAILAVTLSSALAAIGFGMLLGTLARTHDQAAMIGSISTVIAASIGGLMVPIFVMPRLMQQLSVLSPLGWGLDAFLDLFARGGDLSSIWPNLLLLLAFFAGTMFISLFFFVKRV